MASTNTAIQWTDATWNPGRGCSRVSPGCDNCYAMKVAYRFSGAGLPYEGLATLRKGKPDWTGIVREIPDALDAPLHWRKPRRIFVNSQTDLFHHGFSNEFIAAVFGVMAACPQHTFQVLTKRADRMRETLSASEFPELVERFRVIALAGRIGERFAEERIAEIADFPGYFVTSRGRVLSDRKKSGERGQERHEVKPMASEAGHCRVMLYRGDQGEPERLLVHRLVLNAFDRPGTFADQGCHLDGDPTNNALWNLVWGSQSQNWADSKRHGTRRRYCKLSPEQVAELRDRAAKGESGASLGRAFGISDTQARNIVSGKQWAPEHAPEWPLRNCWLGVSAEDQERADERIPDLLATPAAVRFVSAEPLLGPIDFLQWFDPTGACCGIEPECRCKDCPADTCPRGDDGDYLRPDWIIVGGESGQAARPCALGWIENIVEQCADAGIECFVKQLGALPISQHEADGDVEFTLRDRKGGDMSEWSAELRVRQFPEVRQ